MHHIRELQPNGPYLLAGFSFGGLVALEMARRYLANGEDVAMLALLDTMPHPRFLPLNFLTAYWKRRIYAHAAVLVQLPLPKAGPYVLKRLYAAREPIRTRYFDGYRRRGSASEAALPEGLQAVLDAAQTARRRYRPRHYAGTITLLKAEKTGGFWQTYATFWAGLAAALDVYTVPGSHLDILTMPEALGRNFLFVSKEPWGREVAVALQWVLQHPLRAVRLRLPKDRGNVWVMTSSTWP